jgi:seryl-tRNA(Sec) selenium transferase
LPDTTGLRNRVVLPMGHAVNYGHPITQDIRLAGAHVAWAGREGACTVEDIAAACAQPQVAALLLVVSRLTTGAPLDLPAAIAAARRAGVAVIIDAAAQDMRTGELAALGADALIFSAQKYLAAPTCGLVLGNASFIHAIRAQEKGIGRGMKASKEALAGTIAALEARDGWDAAAWAADQAEKVSVFMARCTWRGIHAAEVPDPVGNPFSRVRLSVDATTAGIDATQLAATLKAQRPSVRPSVCPSVRVMEHALAKGEIMLELTGLTRDEVAQLADAFDACFVGSNGAQP